MRIRIIASGKMSYPHRKVTRRNEVMSQITKTPATLLVYFRRNVCLGRNAFGGRYVVFFLLERFCVP